MLAPVNITRDAMTASKIPVGRSVMIIFVVPTKAVVFPRLYRSPIVSHPPWPRSESDELE